MNNLKPYFVAIMLWFLASCNKVEKPAPYTPQIHDTVLTSEKLVGKWEVTDAYAYYFRNDTLIQSWEVVKGVGVWGNGKKKLYAHDSLNTLITFNSDGRFNHTNMEGRPDGYMLEDLLTPSGNWKIGQDSSIELTSPYPNNVIRDTTWTWTFRDSLLQIRTTFKNVTPTSLQEDFVIFNMIKNNY